MIILSGTKKRSSTQAIIHMYIIGYFVVSITAALHYVNPNIELNPATNTMWATEDIAMGTILAIDPPLIELPFNFTHFTQRFFDSYDDEPFRQLIQSFPKINTDTHFAKQLMDSLPNEVRLNGMEMFHLLREYHLRNTIHHLSWNSILYPTMPFIKTGFRANVAIFENQNGFADVANDDNCIVIMAASNLTAGETLIKPLDFMRKLMFSSEASLVKFIMNIEAWKEKALVHLDHNDTKLLMEHWHEFKYVAARWTLYKLEDDRNEALYHLYLYAAIHSPQYQNLLRLLYETKFAPEILPVGMQNVKRFTHEYELGQTVWRCIHKRNDGVYVFNHAEFMDQVVYESMSEDVLHLVLKDFEFLLWFSPKHREPAAKRRRIEM